MNLFYADDDEDDRDIFCEAIQQINPAIKVTLSKDGYEAFEILSNQDDQPDLIFLDINMPRMNGIECMAKLKSDARLKVIPVIIYSTTTNKSDVKRLKTLGASDFIPKAYSFEKLKEDIQRVLNKDLVLKR